MTRFPSVYRFSKKGSEFSLYLGEYSTVDLLSKFEEATHVQVTEFAATNFESDEHVFLEELPVLNSVASVIEYINSIEGAVSLIDFAVEIHGVGSLRTHDDGECNVITTSQKVCFELIQKVAPLDVAEPLVDTLKLNPEVYLQPDKNGEIQRFTTFDEYIKSVD